MTATLTETPTSADTPEPTETATPALKYPAPVLLEPSNGLQYSGRGGQILLRWEPVGVLAPDEFYGVSLRYVSNGGVAYAGTWTQDTSWRVPRELWQKYDQGHPQYEWDVVVMRQTGTDASGGRKGEAISPKSETRVFIWE